MITLTPKNLQRFLTATLPTSRLPVFIWGQPGTAKSASVYATQAALNADLAEGEEPWQLFDFRAYLHEPVDMTGVPSVVDGRTILNPPDWLPRSGRGILLIDELPNASPSMINVCLQLVQDRRIGQYVLPAGFVIVAVGNRVSDRAGARQIATSVANRFSTHLDVQVSHAEWHAWALEHNVFPPVLSYLSFVPAALQEFDPTTAAAARSFPTLRSWTNLAALLPHTPRDLWLAAAIGAVGEGRGTEFVAHAEIWEALPAPAAVIADADNHALPSDPSVVYALAHALVEHLREAVRDGGDLDAIGTAIATIALRWATGDTVDGKKRKEQSVLLMRDATILDATAISSDAGGQWAAANPEMAEALTL